LVGSLISGFSTTIDVSFEYHPSFTFESIQELKEKKGNEEKIKKNLQDGLLGNDIDGRL